MIEYRIIAENLQNNECGKYFSYGVFAYSNDSRTAVRSYSDVFLVKERAENFVNCCNVNNLDPVHLYDVIEDEIV